MWIFTQFPRLSRKKFPNWIPGKMVCRTCVFFKRQSHLKHTSPHQCVFNCFISGAIWNQTCGVLQLPSVHNVACLSLYRVSHCSLTISSTFCVCWTPTLMVRWRSPMPWPALRVLAVGSPSCAARRLISTWTVVPVPSPTMVCCFDASVTMSASRTHVMIQYIWHLLSDLTWDFNLPLMVYRVGIVLWPVLTDMCQSECSAYSCLNVRMDAACLREYYSQSSVVDGRDASWYRCHLRRILSLF